MCAMRHGWLRAYVCSFVLLGWVVFVLMLC